MRTLRDIATDTIAALDQARASGLPVDEHGIIEAGLLDACDVERARIAPEYAELQRQIKVRDDELAELKRVFGVNGGREFRRNVRQTRRTQARTMRSNGATFREIARALGYKSPGFVHKMLRDAPAQREEDGK